MDNNSMEEKYLVYYLSHPITKLPYYVGQKRVGSGREYHHKSLLSETKQPVEVVNNIIIQFGYEPLFKVIEELNGDEIDAAEIMWIELFSQLFNLINCTSGGSGVKNPVINKLSKERKSKASKKVWEGADERRKELSIKMSGKSNPFYGKKHTPETQDRINSNIRKVVYMFQNINGDTYTTDNIKQFCSEYSLIEAGIRGLAYGNTIQTKDGWFLLDKIIK